MELKQYQHAVIGDLRSYLQYLQETQSSSEAFRRHWSVKQVSVGLEGLTPYQNLIPQAPHVCYKVPTGGGKTLLACASIKPIMDALPQRHAQVVVWLVPSDAILTQTLHALKDADHPYRQWLQRDFHGRVEVYSKEELLAGQNFSPTTLLSQLSIMVLSYDSFRSKRRDWRKAYQANGALESFRDKLAPSDMPIPDADDTALFQVINQLNPVVIVDESHHARSALSLEMLKNFNPAFVLDITATPTKQANIISYVDAVALKKEHMVKLPVTVYNRTSSTELIRDAIGLRNSLEHIAHAEQERGGDYIRPIVLFQAQPKTKESATSFERLKEKLVEAGIEVSQIAIKTAEINELERVDLLSPQCPIRYIITVNALKEGWDCPFAYILASLANKTSRVDVEQIVGRILRQPYARRHSNSLLNLSYVLTSSANFQQTIDDVVLGLNAAGFSGKDYRIGDNPDISDVSVGQSSVSDVNEPLGIQTTQEDISDAGIEVEQAEDFLIFDSERIAREMGSSQVSLSQPLVSVDTMVKQAESMEAEYTREMKQDEHAPSAHIPQEVQRHMNCFAMESQFKASAQALRIPRFCYQCPNTLFSGDEPASWALVSPESLGEGFRLQGKDSTLDIGRLHEELVYIDVNDSSDRPKAFNMDTNNQQIFRQYLNAVPEESRVSLATEAVFKSLDTSNTCESGDLKRYIQAVVENLEPSQLKILEDNPYGVANKIKEKIDVFLAEHRAEKFYELLMIGDIQTREEYRLPEYISPTECIDSIGKSLYTSEGAMNQQERDLIMKIAQLDNVVWWHRIYDRDSKRAFYINGVINHYPDFMIYTKKGKVVLVESKGEMLKNADSAIKIALGEKWAQAAGSNYHYYMVFRDDTEPLQGAYTTSKFLNILAQL